MSDVLQQVLADLAAEGERLDSLVADLGEAEWRSPTPAAGWDVATQVSHLAWTDEAALLAATDRAGWDDLVLVALGDPDGIVDRAALAGGVVPREELLARWRGARAALAVALRSAPADQKMPWFGPPMSPTSMATARFMETWAHSLDVHQALGQTPDRTDRIRHVAHLGVRTRGFSFAAHGLPAPAADVRVELVAPSGAVWVWGSVEATDRVSGLAWDFCLLVTQRIHRDDTDLVSRGEVAEQWLCIAQCFAGPAGEGRARRG